MRTLSARARDDANSNCAPEEVGGYYLVGDALGVRFGALALSPSNEDEDCMLASGFQSN